MSTHNATDAAHATVLDHKVFEEELKRADALVYTERHIDRYSPDVLLQVRINLPSHVVLARYIERFQYQLLWYPDQEEWVHGWPVPGVKLLTAHRTYPQRDTVILMFTQHMTIWRKLQLSQVSRSITFIECVNEDNVVGDLQITYLLTRAARRVNEGLLSIDQFRDDMRRTFLAVRDGKGPLRGDQGFPQVLFTVGLLNEFNLDDNGKPRWKDIDRAFNSTRSAWPKFVSERPCEGGSELTLRIPKFFWPYIGAISESYRFAGYVGKEKHKEMFPDRRLFTPFPEPEPEQESEPQPESRQAPTPKATSKRTKEKAKKPAKNKITKQRSKKSKRAIAHAIISAASWRHADKNATTKRSRRSTKISMRS